MQRRKFLTSAGAGLAASAAVIPTLTSAQTAVLPMIKWRMTSSFSKSLDTIFGGAETIARRVKSAAGGKFEIQVFAAGKIVPAFSAMDAVKDGTVECCHTAPYYFFGKDLTFAFASAIPFGMNARQQNAWMFQGSGMALVREFLKDCRLSARRWS